MQINIPVPCVNKDIFIHLQNENVNKASSTFLAWNGLKVTSNVDTRPGKPAAESKS